MWCYVLGADRVFDWFKDKKTSLSSSKETVITNERVPNSELNSRTTGLEKEIRLLQVKTLSVHVHCIVHSIFSCTWLQLISVHIRIQYTLYSAYLIHVYSLVHIYNSS